MAMEESVTGGAQSGGRSQTKKAVVKFPYRQVLPAYLGIFSFFFGLFMVLPFLPFMTKNFLDSPRNEIGYYAGFLTSAYSFGDLLGCTVWGNLADRVGRRPILTISPLLSSVFVLLFGFSKSFAWAVVARICWGFCASTMAVTKALLGESSSESNRARIFALIGFCNGIARLIGPSLGALLYDPSSKYAGMDNDFWTSNPYLLPCLIAVSVNLVSFLAALFFLKETLHLPRKQASAVDPQLLADDETRTTDQTAVVAANGCQPSLPDAGVKLNGHASRQLSSPSSDDTELFTVCLDDPDKNVTGDDNDDDAFADEATELWDLSSHSDLFAQNTNGELKLESQEDRPPHVANSKPQAISRRVHHHIARLRHVIGRPRRHGAYGHLDNAHRGGDNDCPVTQKPRLGSGVLEVVLNYIRAFKLLRVRVIRLAVSMYFTMAFTGMMWQETGTLLLVNNHKHGGYCFNSSEIGVLNAAIAFFQLFTQALVYPLVAKRFGYRRTFRIMLTLCALTSIAFPWGSTAIGSVDPWPRPSGNSTNGTWTVPPALDGENRTVYPSPASGPNLYNGGPTNDSLLNMEQCYVADPLVWQNQSVSLGNDTYYLLNKTTLELDQCGRVVSDQRYLLPPERQASEFKLLSCLAWWIWPAMLAFNLPVNVVLIMSFTCCNVFINNSCDQSIRARVTAIGQFLAASGRVVAPFISVLFAWSTDNGLPLPLNFHLCFWVIAAMCVCIAAVSLKLPDMVEGGGLDRTVPPTSASANGAVTSADDEEGLLAVDVEEEVSL